MTRAPPTAVAALFFGDETMTVIYGICGGDGRLLSRPLMERAVALTWGWTELPRLERSPRGKPEFAGKAGYWMSLSHSGGYALCALSDDGPVGVDIEVVRPHRQRLPEYAMSGEELAGFDGSWEEFARIWTLKESWCKREDTPLFPPREVPTPPPCPHGTFFGGDWRAAVCCHGTPPVEILWLDEL